MYIIYIYYIIRRLERLVESADWKDFFPPARHFSHHVSRKPLCISPHSPMCPTSPHSLFNRCVLGDWSSAHNLLTTLSLADAIVNLHLKPGRPGTGTALTAAIVQNAPVFLVERMIQLSRADPLLRDLELLSFPIGWEALHDRTREMWYWREKASGKSQWSYPNHVPVASEDDFKREGNEVGRGGGRSSMRSNTV